MGVYYDADIAGNGIASLSGGNQVLFFSVDILTLGGNVSLIEPDLTDHVLRAGWISLGDTFDAGPGSAQHWREVVWMNFLENLWTAIPSGDPSGATTVLATLVRWWLSPGTTAHLHVFGT